MVKVTPESFPLFLYTLMYFPVTAIFSTLKQNSISALSNCVATLNSLSVAVASPSQDNFLVRLLTSLIPISNPESYANLLI